MDKYEYNLKLEEITKLADQGYYEDAADIIDTIDWRRVRNVRTLCMISEIYEEVGRLQDSKALLLRAYRKSQAVRSILFHLTEISVKLREFDDAAEFYSEFVEAAPHDNSRYLLKYMIYRGRGAAIEDQIEILEEYNQKEYMPVGHGNPIGRRTLLQILPDVLAHAFPSFASQINSTEMSAGLTPLMRDAWPIFAGMTFCSFSCASSRRPVMVL